MRDIIGSDTDEQNINFPVKGRTVHSAGQERWGTWGRLRPQATAYAGSRLHEEALAYNTLHRKKVTQENPVVGAFKR